MTDGPTPPPTLVDVESFDVVGIAARSSPAREVDPSTAELPRLWQRFFDENVGRRVAGAIPGRVATVYHEYAPADGDEYTVVLGPVARPGHAVPAGLTRVHVPGGAYLTFAVNGMPPDAITAAWSRVHAFFAADAAHRRAFTVDFEMLRPGATTISISVSDLDGREG